MKWQDNRDWTANPATTLQDINRARAQAQERLADIDFQDHQQVMRFFLDLGYATARCGATFSPAEIVPAFERNDYSVGFSMDDLPQDADSHARWVVGFVLDDIANHAVVGSTSLIHIRLWLGRNARLSEQQG